MRPPPAKGDAAAAPAASPDFTAPASGEVTPATGESKGFFPFSLPALPFGHNKAPSGQETAFDPKQRALLDRVSVSADDKFITVVIEEKQVMVGTTRLMIMFDAKTATLKQWTVTDPQGLDTTVAVYNLDSTQKPDPNLFVINYQRNPGSFSNQ